MTFKIAGTNYATETVAEWLAFEHAVERRELASHKELCLPETARKIREGAVQAVIASGLFSLEAATNERSEPATSKEQQKSNA
jgi:hypothetical protein